MTNLYYQPPSDKVFKEVKKEAIEIWKMYDNTYGDVDEKVNKIKDLKNVRDNLMYMVAMFDMVNQRLLARKLSKGAKKAIADRIRLGGAPDRYNEFL